MKRKLDSVEENEEKVITKTPKKQPLKSSSSVVYALLQKVMTPWKLLESSFQSSNNNNKKNNDENHGEKDTSHQEGNEAHENNYIPINESCSSLSSDKNGNSTLSTTTRTNASLLVSDNNIDYVNQNYDTIQPAILSTSSSSFGMVENSKLTRKDDHQTTSIKTKTISNKKLTSKEDDVEEKLVSASDCESSLKMKEDDDDHLNNPFNVVSNKPLNINSNLFHKTFTNFSMNGHPPKNNLNTTTTTATTGTSTNSYSFIFNKPTSTAFPQFSIPRTPRTIYSDKSSVVSSARLHHSRQSSSGFGSVKFGRIAKNRPTYSVLQQQNIKQKGHVFKNLASEHILSFKEASDVGFKGTERDFSELIDYAKKVYETSVDHNQSENKTEDSSSARPLEATRKIIEKLSDKHEDLWLKNLRETIESYLKNKTIDEKVDLKVETPLYDQLEQKKQLLKEKIDELKISEEKDISLFGNFPRLDDDALAQVHSALGPGSGIVVDEFNVELQKDDIRTLRDGQWLNDEIINFYGQMIMQRAEKDSSLPKIHFFNTFFYTTLRDQGYDRVRRWTRRIDLFSKDVAIIPVHLGMHWCCSIINFKKKRIEYYDSLHGNNPKCFELLRLYLAKEHLDKKKAEFDFTDWQDYAAKDIPSQQNGYDCGVFACIFAEYCSRQEPFDFSQENMKYYRKRIVYEILKTELLVQRKK